jgi:hypothetical protein
MLLAAEKLHETVEFLDEALKRTWEPGERLILLVRLWRARLGLGETTEARQALREAEGIATDRNQLLARVHECILSHLRQEVGGLKVKTSTETPRPSDLKRLAEVLLDLGETAQAVSLTASDSSALATRDLLKIHSEVAAQEADYFRATEILKPLGPDRHLAFAAERSGDYLLACRTLEHIATAAPSPEVRSSMQRVYRQLVLQELDPGKHKLLGETVLRFGLTT